MEIAEKINFYNNELKGSECQLIAISKTKPNEMILEAMEAGQIDFGENKVQELVRKSEELPKEINWHMVGHLQRNKVKYIAPFIHLIHSVDSHRLLQTVDKEGEKNGRVISVLLQVHIASEETKFGFDFDEIKTLLSSQEMKDLHHIKVLGFMGMATNTNDSAIVANEFHQLRQLFEDLKTLPLPNIDLKHLSMGMSGDYKIAIANGSTMIRIGSDIFGQRNYAG